MIAGATIAPDALRKLRRFKLVCIMSVVVKTDSTREHGQSLPAATTNAERIPRLAKVWILF